MKYVRLVREFNEAFGCGARSSPGVPEPGQRLVRAQLMLEELAEVTEAAANGDLLATLCEALDLQYVVDGTFVVYGIDQGVDLADWLTACAGPPALPDTEDAMLMMVTTLGKTISEAVGCMIGGGDWRVVASALIQVRSAVFSLWCQLRVPEELRWAMFQALHAANMAKLGGGLSPGGRVIKPEGWQPADQRLVLARHNLIIPQGCAAAVDMAGKA